MNQDELHDLVMQLKDGLDSGKLRVRDRTLYESLEKVRISEDGKVDPATVDGNVKAMGLAFSAAQMEKEMREVPLREIQAEYFDLLEHFFGKPFSEMRRNNVTPAQVAEQMASQERIVQAFQSELEEFTSWMNDFWEHFGPIVDLHVSELKCLKAVFGGDVFPSYKGNIACSVGLYMDTLVFPDPLMRILNLARVTDPRESFRLLAKHALSAMTYRDLALAEIDPPIVVVVPDPMFLENSYLSKLQDVSDVDMLKHASAMFGERFDAMADLHQFLNQFPRIEDLTAKLADSKRFLFDVDWTESPAEQFTRYLRGTASHIADFKDASVGETTLRAFLGRMMQTNDLLLRSDMYRGTPLIEAETSWQYLLWKYEYDSIRGQRDPDLRNIFLSRAIAVEGNTHLGMLAGVPPEALIELRRNGAMAQLRETFREGINDIDLASLDLLEKVTEEVVRNLDRSFERHDKELEDVKSSRRKFFGLDVSRWIVTGGVSVAAAALTHTPALGVAAAAAPYLIGAPSIPELGKKWKEVRERKRAVQGSSAAILFRHLGRKFGFS